ncbi:relaxase domain-containing protein [Arthrobacter sp. efr-133-TYG-118]|uniref:relaxase domain-containing protein n=1 Tax=Arthrobacter sp. efr-133-TYG-118 TaxID=3040279 RepID=UPI00254C72DB|nr:relaxase domain-containing protein [Arthrobacter sp. efr-133-TYG-118]
MIVWPNGTRGAIAAAFDHWESRTGDPQLHTHLVIANRIQRITDGAWVTLDSRTLYKAADIRQPATNIHNHSQQLSGIDDALIREFSNGSASSIWKLTPSSPNGPISMGLPRRQ